MGAKSTKTLGYNLKGTLDLDNMTITEISEEEEIVHDLQAKLEQFDGQEISIAFSLKIKLEDGVE